MMKNPAHPGECLKEMVEESGWSIKETAKRMNVSRTTLSRLLNGQAKISPSIALALEGIGWSNAEFWLRVQSSYDLAQLARHREKRPTRPSEQERKSGQSDRSQQPVA